ncbi:hypothetical protein GWK47_052215 [Chionoecetes opilio]|uniref:Uncharacterized protein n=1 Tax=Chionoecetes opilio TaxID=41210 RepID=A0A8J5CRJ6_CHIOP|nr:hypothetical protein GWK47_052215 [Chionoecetes opilio]
MEKIPQTQEALLLPHTARIYQLESGQPVINVTKPPTPEGFGWTLESATKPGVLCGPTCRVASQACSELVKCGCKSATCGGRCSCKKAQWK